MIYYIKISNINYLKFPYLLNVKILQNFFKILIIDIGVVA